jgi:hypothetical protein
MARGLVRLLSTMARDDFTSRTKQLLAKRVAYRCSFPSCSTPTIGPGASSSEAVVQVGEAAHISAASPGGARYDASMTSAQRKHIDNGIWMCGTHATEIDQDATRYSKELLIDWKKDAEDRALKQRQHSAQIVRPTPHITGQQLFQESIARCVIRWMALGLERTKALELANDQTVGAIELKNADLEKPVLVLQGPLGAGKSLALERIFQDMLRNAESDPSKPLPLFLKAENAFPLENVVLEHCTKVGASDPSNLTVFIDGADEISRSDAGDLMEAAQHLTLKWSSTKVLLTTRPLTGFAKSSEVLEIAELSKEATAELIGKIRGVERPYDRLWTYPKSIREAAKRPFFAVLLASYEQRTEVGSFLSTSELLDWLVDNAIKHTERKRPIAQQFLERLAKKSIDSGGKSIHLQDVGSREDLQTFLESGLVEQRGQYIRFALPVLAQWFAARSLESGQANIQEIAKTSRQLDRWRYPIGMLVGKSNFENITRILEPIAVNDIGFVGVILHDALSLNHFGPNGEPLPDEAECVRRIGIAMDALSRGMSTTGSKISPQRLDGRNRTLWARVNQHHLTVGWADLELQQYKKSLGQSTDFTGFEGGGRSGTIDTRQEGWVWKLAKDRLASTLDDRLRNQSFDLEYGPIAEENFWSVALTYAKHIHDSRQPPGTIQGFGPTPEGIPFDSYFHYAELDLDAASVQFKNVRYKPAHLQRWRNQLLEQGITEARAPWPLPDQLHLRSGWVHNRYSDAQMLARTQKIYSGALEAYQQMVTHWFPEFQHRLLLAATLPAQMIGLMERDEFGPVVGWRFEPLPKDASSSVTVAFGDKEFWDESLYERLRSMRPEASEWIRPISYIQVLDHYTNDEDPMTKLAYEWLKDDLRLLHWL